MVSDKYPRKPSDSNFSFQAMVMATTMELETIMTIMDRAMEREMEMRTETRISSESKSSSFTALTTNGQC